MNSPHPFSRSWFLALAIFAVIGRGTPARSEPVITEFMAANSVTLADEDGTYSDWLELHNPDPVAVDVTGWYLTDSANNRTKWQLPATSLPPGGYLIVFASNKDRRDPNARLHTNFALSAGGEYLGLIKADGVTAASEYAPEYPAQADDISYGLPRNPDGTSGAPAILSVPTPGAANSAASAANLAETVQFSREAGPFTDVLLLQLSGGSPGQRIRYVVTPAHAASAAPEPTATSAEYTGPITLSESSLVRAAVFSNDGTSRGKISSAYYAKLGASLGSFSSQLPVMVIDSLGSGGLVKDGVDHPSWLYLYGATGGTPTFVTSPEVISPLTTTVRGSSSAEFPKKGYNVKFTDADGREDEQALLGLPAHEKWAFVAPWSFDMTYINNAIVYALSSELGRWAPKTRLVEVFFNADGGEVDLADYAGIYVITDRIEAGKNRIDIEELSPSDLTAPDITGGYVLKIDWPDEDEISWATTKLPEFSDSSLILVEPDEDDITPAQLDYIKTYTQRMEDALLADQSAGFVQRTYLDYIDRDSWVDHHLLNTFASNPDAFYRSAYFTKDRGGKLEAGPVWDFDRALGSFWDPRSQRWDIWFGVESPDYWNFGWWGIIARDPEFMQDWIDRWQSLRRDELSNSSLESLVDSLSGQIGTEAAHRDSTRWPDSASPYGSYAAQIDFLRNWMTQRAGWIDEQFVSAPAIGDSAGELVFTPPEGAELVYTLDGSDPRSVGGEIAPNAVRTSSELTVSPESNIHVRSYRADLRGVFPGSPWSSAVGGISSSPLEPRARLINISSRGIVGAGENALIAGVVIADTAGKRYLARAVGPGLVTFGTSDVVSDPQLGIFAEDGVELFRNNGWGTGPDAARIPSYSESAGAFPLLPGTTDSALAEELGAGLYTIQVTSPTDQSGIGLAELYELDRNGRTVNLSTRARVGTGDRVLIGGFVVQGPAYKRMLIRAVGPTLGLFAVTNALQDPVLTVRSVERIVVTNDQWETGDDAEAVAIASQRVGAFTLPTGSEDAAVLITLPPGAYTVEVGGKGDTEGVGLLEIYEVP